MTPNYNVLPHLVQSSIRLHYENNIPLPSHIQPIVNNDLKTTVLMWRPENFDVVLATVDWLVHFKDALAERRARFENAAEPVRTNLPTSESHQT